MNQLTVIFLGPQGSGKGTQVDLLIEHLKKIDSRPVALFSMGHALRTFAAAGGYAQEMVAASLARGELQPLFLVSAMLAQYMIDNLHGDEHLIVDGFPREENQIHVFDSMVNFYRRKEPFVLDVNVSDEVAVERLLKRGRHDDSAESIKHRLSWSRTNTAAVLEWFKSHPSYEYLEINGEQEAPAVHADILRALNL